MIARILGKLAAPAILLTLFSLSPARADIFTWNNQPYASMGTICGETDTGGCLGTFLVTMADETVVTITIGSDGEQHFDPFAFGFDTGDVISFQGLGSSTVNSVGLGWMNVSTNGPVANTWVLPADLTGIGCGQEDETTCEPVGDFVLNQPFMDSFPNSPNGGLWGIILDENGDGSDWIFAANTAPNGNGEILFFSDPAAPIPEPATMFLMGAGLIGFWYLTRKRKSS